MGIPRGVKAVYQGVSSTFCCELRGGDNEHVRPPAEAICKKDDVRISSGRGRQGSKINKSTLTAFPGLFGEGTERVGHRMV